MTVSSIFTKLIFQGTFAVRRGAIAGSLGFCALLLAGCATDPGKPPQLSFLGGYARALAWSPDNRLLVAVRDAELVFLDGKTLKVLARSKSTQKLTITAPPAAIVFSPDGATLATTGINGGAWIWDVAARQPLRRMEDSVGTTAIAFTPDGQGLIAAGPAAPLRHWSAETGALIATFPGGAEGIVSLAASRDARWLATGEISGRVRLWTLPTREIVTAINNHAGPVLSVAFSPDGTLLASAANGRDVRLLKLDGFVEQARLIDPRKPTEQARFATGLLGLLGAVSAAREINMIGAPGPGTAALLAGPAAALPATTSINCPVTFSPDGRLLAAIRHSSEMAGEYHLEVYEVSSGRQVSRYTGAISSLAFCHDGQRVAVSGIIRVILLDPATGKETSRTL